MGAVSPFELYVVVLLAVLLGGRALQLHGTAPHHACWLRRRQRCICGPSEKQFSPSLSVRPLPSFWGGRIWENTDRKTTHLVLILETMYSRKAGRTGWRFRIELWTWNYYVCCSGDVFLMLLRHLTNSIQNRSISGVQSCLVTRYTSDKMVLCQGRVISSSVSREHVESWQKGKCKELIRRLKI